MSVRMSPTTVPPEIAPPKELASNFCLGVAVLTGPCLDRIMCLVPVQEVSALSKRSSDVGECGPSILQ